MRIKYVILLIVALLSICTRWSFAQIRSEHMLVDEALKLLNSFQQQYYDPSFRMDSAEMETLFNKHYITRDSLKMLHAIEAMKHIQHDYGLALSGRISNYEISGNEELSTSLNFKAGIEWDLLDEGLLSNRDRIKKLRAERDIQLLESELQVQQSNYPYLYYQMIYVFNQKKIEVLPRYLSFMKELVQLLETSSHLHYIPREKILDYESKLREYEVLQLLFKQYNEHPPIVVDFQAQEIDAGRLPIYRIDIHELQQANQTAQRLKTVAELKQQQLVKPEAINHNWRLKAYGSYNMRPDPDRNNYVHFGVAATIPLAFNKKEQENMVRLEQTMIEQESRYRSDNIDKELLNLYYEYNVKLKQYTRFHYQYYRLKDKLRLNKALLDKGLTSPFHTLNMTTELYETSHELIGIKEQMYLLLLKMRRYVTGIKFDDYLSPIDLERIIAHPRWFMMLREENLRDFEPKWLMAYLEKNKFRHLLIEGKISQKHQGMLIQRGFVLYEQQPFDASIAAEAKTNSFAVSNEEGGTKYIIKSPSFAQPVVTSPYSVEGHVNRNEMELQVAEKKVLLISDFVQFYHLDIKTLKL